MSNIGYKISGKYDPKAIKEAKSGIQSLGDSASKLKGVFAAVAGAAVVKGVFNLAKNTIAEFQIGQNALAQLTNSIKNNANLTSASLKNLTTFASQMQSKGIYGDDELLKQASYLSSLGLTEDKIKNVMTASANLAAAGVMPLDAAVKNLAKQYAGVGGELAKQMPALKSLTAEQLKAGEGIALVQRQFAGALETAAGTLEGKTIQVQNIVGDIKEKIGAVFGAGKETVLDAILPVLQRIDTWFENNQNKIINFFKYLPEVMQIIGQTLLEIIKKAFNVEYMLNVFKAVIDYLWNALKIIVKNLGPLFIEAFKEVINNVMYIQYRLAKMIDLIGASLMDAFMGVANTFINSIINGINKAIETINKLPGIKIDTIAGVNIATNKAAAVTSSTGNYDEWKKASWSGALAANPAADIGKNLSSFFTESMANVGKLAADLVEPFGDIFTDAGEKIGVVLNRQAEVIEQTADVVAAVQTTAIASPTVSVLGESAGISGGGDTGIAAYIVPEFQTALAPLGEMFSSFGSIGNIFGQLSGALGPLIEGFNMFSPIINWGATIMKGMMQVLAPVLDSLLKPLIGILIIVGRVIGAMLVPVLKMLTPVIELISKAFVFLYNYAIRPLANAIIWVVSTIYNMVANLVNAIIKAINIIPGVNIKWRMQTMDYESMKLQKIEESDLAAAGESESGDAGGKSASYSGSRDVIVNIYYQNSYVNGDTRAIALNIRDEIKSAEKLGA